MPTKGDAAVLTNHFTEFKGPSAANYVADHQACYNGAIGARAVNELRSFSTDGSILDDNNAYTITSTYCHGLLNIHTAHTTHQHGAPQPERHTNRVGTWFLPQSSQQFREGVGAYRHSKEWAEEVEREWYEKPTTEQSNEIQPRRN